MSKHLQKGLAAYYTPTQVSNVLCRLTIKNKFADILEPSFGGCSFLENSYKQLKELGAEDPSKQIYGFDIDKYALKSLKGNFPNAINKNFKLIDFLKSHPNDFGKKFDVVLGNPPYLPISKMKNKGLAWDLVEKDNISFSRRASLWVYFITHSTKFLKKGGRLTFIIPDSILFTTYGKQIQKFLCASFGKVDLIKINERIFLDEGTMEKTLFLMCDDFGESCHNTHLVKYSSFNSFCKNIIDLKSNFSEISPSFAGIQISEKLNSYELSQLCDVRIGIVTGASKYVIIDQQAAKQLRLNTDFYYPILTNGKYFKGINLAPNFFDFKEQHRRLYLIDFEKLFRNKKSQYYRLKGKIPKDILTNATFIQRKHWYDMDDRKIPHGIMVYHSTNGPRIALNSAKVNVTNSIHRLFFKAKYNKSYFIKLVCISTLTSYTQYHAELIGRSYGTGSLKLEPGEAKKLRVLIPKFIDKAEIDSVFNKINGLLNEGKHRDAREAADNLIFQHDQKKFDECVRRDFDEAILKIKALRVA